MIYVKQKKTRRDVRRVVRKPVVLNRFHHVLSSENLANWNDVVADPLHLGGPVTRVGEAASECSEHRCTATTKRHALPVVFDDVPRVSLIGHLWVLDVRSDKVGNLTKETAECGKSIAYVYHEPHDEPPFR